MQSKVSSFTITVKVLVVDMVLSKCWQVAKKLATLMSEMPEERGKGKADFNVCQSINLAAYLLNLTAYSET